MKRIIVLLGLVATALIAVGAAQASCDNGLYRYRGLQLTPGNTPQHNTMTLYFDSWAYTGQPNSHGFVLASISDTTDDGHRSASNWVQIGIGAGPGCGENYLGSPYIYVETRHGAGPTCGGCPNPQYPYSCGYNDGQGHTYSLDLIEPISFGDKVQITLDQANYSPPDYFYVAFTHWHQNVFDFWYSSYLDGHSWKMAPFTTSSSHQLIGTGEVYDPAGICNEGVSARFRSYNHSWELTNYYGHAPTNITFYDFDTALP